MTILTDLQDEMKTAMKARDQARLDALRLLISSIKYAQVDTPDMGDAQIVEVLKKEAKKRREAIVAYQGAGRGEAADVADLGYGRRRECDADLSALRAMLDLEYEPQSVGRYLQRLHAAIERGDAAVAPFHRRGGVDRSEGAGAVVQAGRVVLDSRGASRRPGWRTFSRPDGECPGRGLRPEP